MSENLSTEKEFAEYLKDLPDSQKTAIHEVWMQFLEKMVQSPNAAVLEMAILQFIEFSLTYKVKSLCLITHAIDQNGEDFFDANLCWPNTETDPRLLSNKEKKKIIQTLTEKLYGKE